MLEFSRESTELGTGETHALRVDTAIIFPIKVQLLSA
jgi:hypothetical protein